MTRTVAEKMGIKSGMTAFFVGAPEEAIAAIRLPDIDVKSSLAGEFDYIHLFTTSKADFKQQFPLLKKHLSATGTLWVSWPKSKQLDSDLTLIKVIELGYDFGLVESTCLSINSVWSALKFTHPKKGKIYNNSYGKLMTDQ